MLNDSRFEWNVAAPCWLYYENEVIFLYFSLFLSPPPIIALWRLDKIEYLTGSVSILCLLHWPHILIACLFIIVELFSLFLLILFPPFNNTISTFFAYSMSIWWMWSSFFPILVPMYMFRSLHSISFINAVWMCTVISICRLYWLTFCVCQHWLWIYRRFGPVRLFSLSCSFYLLLALQLWNNTQNVCNV